MLDEIGGLGEKYPVPSTDVGTLRRVTLKQQLERDRAFHQDKLDAINKALALMQENPKLVEMLEAIQKAR